VKSTSSGLAYAIGVPVLIAVLALIGAHVLTPTIRLSESRPRIDLERQVPKEFGRWRELRGIVPVMPNPEAQALLDATYTQVLSRTYEDPRGVRVMLSVAYGSDQGSEATAVHRPEFCYSAQGFKVVDLGQRGVPLTSDWTLPSRMLRAIQGQRNEFVLYWVTLDDAAVLPGFQRKLAQVSFGLKGEIPDGLLFRVSVLAPNTDPDAHFRALEEFVREMYSVIDSEVRSRYFGQRG